MMSKVMNVSKEPGPVHGEGNETSLGEFSYAGTVTQNVAHVPAGCGPFSSSGADGEMTLTFGDGQMLLRRTSTEGCFEFPLISRGEWNRRLSRLERSAHEAAGGKRDHGPHYRSPRGEDPSDGKATAAKLSRGELDRPAGDGTASGEPSRERRLQTGHYLAAGRAGLCSGLGRPLLLVAPGPPAPFLDVPDPSEIEAMKPDRVRTFSGASRSSSRRPGRPA